MDKQLCLENGSAQKQHPAIPRHFAFISHLQGQCCASGRPLMHRPALVYTSPRNNFDASARPHYEQVPDTIHIGFQSMFSHGLTWNSNGLQLISFKRVPMLITLCGIVHVATLVPR